MKFQVRRPARLRVGNEHMLPWMVVGGDGRSLFSVRIPCQTKREAYYRKARLVAGLDPFADEETLVDGVYVDGDGVWSQ